MIADNESIKAEDLKPDENALKTIQDQQKKAEETRQNGGPGGPGGGNREAMMKQFDKDGDGKLSDSEREAIRSQFGGGRGPGGGGGGGQRGNRGERGGQ